MPDMFRAHPVETRIFLVLLLMIAGLSLTTDTFLTLGNITSLLNNNAVNLIWAVGLLVVLIAGALYLAGPLAPSRDVEPLRDEIALHSDRGGRPDRNGLR